MASLPLIAGLELGGTKCIAVLASGPGDVREQVRVPTTDPRATLAALEGVLDGWAFDAIGIGSFGPLQLERTRPDFGSITATPKAAWSGIDLTRRFSARYSRPLAIQTDVAGAALAEERWGAARGMATHAYVTIGTGVGVGLIVGGHPVQGTAHGEAGHMRVPRMAGDGFAGLCPFHGDCVEGLISGPALASRFGRAGRDVPHDAPEWEWFVHDLGGLLHNLVVTAAPERIAIGGGVMSGHEALFPRVRARLAQSLGGYGSFATYAAELDRRVGAPGLGAMAGPLGAIAIGLGALQA